MSETAALMRQTLETEGAAGKYLGLYCLSLFILWMLQQDSEAAQEREKVLIGYGALSLLFMLFPPVVWFISVKAGAVEEMGDFLLLLPLLPVIAYTCTRLCLSQQTVRRKWLCVLSTALVIALSGTVIPYHAPALKSKYADKHVREAIAAVSSQKEILSEPVVLLGQQEIMEDARRFDGEIRLLYGKDMWMAEANTAVADGYPQDYVYIYERMKTDYQYPAEMARLAGRFGCNVLVLRAKIPQESEEYDKWILAAKVPGYVVYRISK